MVSYRSGSALFLRHRRTRAAAHAPWPGPMGSCSAGQLDRASPPRPTGMSSRSRLAQRRRLPCGGSSGPRHGPSGGVPASPRTTVPVRVVAPIGAEPDRAPRGAPGRGSLSSAASRSPAPATSPRRTSSAALRARSTDLAVVGVRAPARGADGRRAHHDTTQIAPKACSPSPRGAPVRRPPRPARWPRPRARARHPAQRPPPAAQLLIAVGRRRARGGGSARTGRSPPLADRPRPPAPPGVQRAAALHPRRRRPPLRAVARPDPYSAASSGRRRQITPCRSFSWEHSGSRPHRGVERCAGVVVRCRPAPAQAGEGQRRALAALPTPAALLAASSRALVATPPPAPAHPLGPLVAEDHVGAQLVRVRSRRAAPPRPRHHHPSAWRAGTRLPLASAAAATAPAAACAAIRV